MNLLLDTHTLIWWLEEPTKLSGEAFLAIVEPRNAVFVSAASVWEIAIKTAIGKLQVPDDLEEAIADEQFMPLPVTFKHALRVRDLPRYDDHKDPFDRLLVAQAQYEGLTLVSRDRRMPRYSLSILEA